MQALCRSLHYSKAKQAWSVIGLYPSHCATFGTRLHLRAWFAELLSVHSSSWSQWELSILNIFENRTAAVQPSLSSYFIPWASLWYPLILPFVLRFPQFGYFQPVLAPQKQADRAYSLLFQTLSCCAASGQRGRESNRWSTGMGSLRRCWNLLP